jgi:hypothetical protein
MNNKIRCYDNFFQDEIAKYIDNLGDDNALMKFRKTALKARHKVQLDQEKQHIEKEIEQSVNELKLQLELNRLKAVEKQVAICFSLGFTMASCHRTL